MEQQRQIIKNGFDLKKMYFSGQTARAGQC